jgi:hypothetical protein
MLGVRRGTVWRLKHPRSHLAGRWGREIVVAAMMVGPTWVVMMMLKSVKVVGMGMPLGRLAVEVYTREAMMHVVTTVIVVWMRVVTVSVTMRILLSWTLTHRALAAHDNLVLTGLALARLVADLVLNLRFVIGQFHDVFKGVVKREVMQTRLWTLAFYSREPAQAQHRYCGVIYFRLNHPKLIGSAAGIRTLSESAWR